MFVDFGFGLYWHTVQLCTCVLQGTFCAPIDALCVIMCEMNDLFSGFQFILDCMWGYVSAAVVFVCSLALVAH